MVERATEGHLLELALFVGSTSNEIRVNPRGDLRSDRLGRARGRADEALGHDTEYGL